MANTKIDDAFDDKDRALRQHYVEAALKALRQAIARNWKDVFLIQTDPDLEPIRQEDAFRQLVEELVASLRAAADQ